MTSDKTKWTIEFENQVANNTYQTQDTQNNGEAHIKTITLLRALKYQINQTQTTDDSDLHYEIKVYNEIQIT